VTVVEFLLTVAILANLLLISTGRLAACVRVLAVQGLALSLIPPLLAGPNVRALVLCLTSAALKGIVFPLLLLRTIRSANIRHENDPLVGYTTSVIVGVLALVLSLLLAPRLQVIAVGEAAVVKLMLTAGLFCMLTGLFLLVSRKTALNQVLGYLTLENGIYLFGLALAREEPLLVETGILLDVFVAVFVMGITIFHISREFDHIDVDQLTELRG